MEWSDKQLIKRAECEAVYNMSQTEGWRILKEWAAKRMDDNLQALVSAKSMEVVAKLQGEYEGLKSVLTEVDYRLKERTKLTTE